MKSKLDPETGFPRVPEGWAWRVDQDGLRGMDSKIEYLWLYLYFPDSDEESGWGHVGCRVGRLWDVPAERVRKRHLIREAESLIPLAKDRIKTEFVSPFIGTYPPKRLEK